MTVLDATKLQDENDLSADEPLDENETDSSEQPSEEAGAKSEIQLLPVRTLTLALPAECETTVNLLVRQEIVGFSSIYRWSYEIKRAYDSLPHEIESDPVLLDDCDACETLGEAITDAANKAAWWLTQHSDDGDEKARAALNWLDEWVFDFDVLTATDDIFDPLPAAETETTVKEAATKIAATATAESLDDAKAHFEKRKAAFAWAIADGHMKLAAAKAQVKSLTKSIDLAVEDLESIVESGPERLPLLDNATPQPVEETESETPLLDSAAAVDPASAGDESWRAVLLADAGIPPALCTVLNEDNQIYNLGQLADTTKEPNTALTDLKKIGKAKAEKIEEALVAYWGTYPQTGGV